MQQNPQEINWLLVILPSLITGLFLLITNLITQIAIAYWLSKKTENYKTDLSREMEFFKLQIQSEFQTEFYQFQTKYSLLHQREAEAMAKIYEISIDLENMVNHTYNKSGQQRHDDVQETTKKYHEYIDTYLKNQIYFDDEICNKIEDVRNLASEMLDRYIAYDTYFNVSEHEPEVLKLKAKAGEEELETHLKIRTEFPRLRTQLKNEIRNILNTKPMQLEKQSTALEAKRENSISK